MRVIHVRRREECVVWAIRVEEKKRRWEVASTSICICKDGAGGKGWEMRKDKGRWEGHRGEGKVWYGSKPLR